MRRVALCLMLSALIGSGCLHHGMKPTAGPSVRPAGEEAPETTAGGLASAPSSFGPGWADVDRPPPRPEPRQIPVGGAEETLTGPNVRVTQLGGASESETAIAVNPTNPMNLIVGAICGGDCAYSSLDGGQTWTQTRFTAPFTSGGDPAVAFCGDGSAFYVELGFGFVGGANYRTGLFVYKSTDGGQTWSLPQTILDHTGTLSFVTDKPWIACDSTGSAFNNRVYVVYSDRAGSLASGIMRVKRSADSGATWSAPVVVSPAAQQNQGFLAIGPSGEVYVAWDWVPPGGYNAGTIRFDKSTNGGVSFGATDVDAATFTGIDADPNFRRLTYPTMAVDLSSGPRRGTIYIAWSDQRSGDPDILLTRSADGGATWSPPVRVNDDAVGNGAEQWAQGLTADPDGRVIVSFSDRRRFIGGSRYEVWGAISRDGGQTFDTNFLIADTPSQVPFPMFLGDYDGVAATSDHLYATWADQRPGLTDAPDIFTDVFPNAFHYDEVKGVVWTGESDMRFDTQDARFGVDLGYDVVRGLLSELRSDHGFGRATCLASYWSAPPFVDAGAPPEGDAYYYLVRARGPTGVGTYGDGSPARPNVRDPLDETLGTCP